MTRVVRVGEPRLAILSALDFEKNRDTGPLGINVVQRLKILSKQNLVDRKRVAGTPAYRVMNVANLQSAHMRLMLAVGDNFGC